MLKRFSSWFIILLMFPQSFVFGQTVQLAIYQGADAYQVYSAVLSMANNARETKNKIIIISQETANTFTGFDGNDADHVCLRPDVESEKIIGAAIVDFIKANKTKWQIQKNAELKIPYKLLNAEEISLIFKENGWNGFYQQYPNSGGLITLSAVGFNADKTVAVVAMGKSCGNLCGEGEYYVLEKKDAKWIPLAWKGDRCSWVS